MNTVPATPRWTSEHIEGGEDYAIRDTRSAGQPPIATAHGRLAAMMLTDLLNKFYPKLFG